MELKIKEILKTYMWESEDIPLLEKISKEVWEEAQRELVITLTKDIEDIIKTTGMLPSTQVDGEIADYIQDKLEELEKGT